MISCGIAWIEAHRLVEVGQRPRRISRFHIGLPALVIGERILRIEGKRLRIVLEGRRQLSAIAAGIGAQNKDRRPGCVGSDGAVEMRQRFGVFL